MFQALQRLHQLKVLGSVLVVEFAKCADQKHFPKLSDPPQRCFVVVFYPDLKNVVNRSQNFVNQHKLQVAVNEFFLTVLDNCNMAL